MKIVMMGQTMELVVIQDVKPASIIPKFSVSLAQELLLLNANYAETTKLMILKYVMTEMQMMALDV